MGVDAPLGVAAAHFAVIMLGADEFAQFSFDHAVMFVGVIDDFAAEFHIFFKRLVAAIDHHTGEPFVDAFFAEPEAVAVVEVDGDREIREAHRRCDQFFEVDRIGILAGPAGNLQHYRSFFFFAGLDDGLKQLHIIDVESAQGVFALEGLREELFGVTEWHIQVSKILFAGTSRE